MSAEICARYARHSRWIGFFAVLAILAAAPAAAREQTFTLTDAVQFALENNHDLRAAESSLAARKDDVGIARSNLLPRAFFEERYLRTNNPTYAFMAKLNQGRFSQQDFAIDHLNHPSPVDDYQTQFGLEQPLFVPKAWIGLDISKREHEAGVTELARKKEEVAFKVCQAWLMVHSAKAQLVMAERGLQDAQEHRRTAQLRYDADLGMFADTLRAGTALAEAKQRKVTADKNYSLARHVLGLLLGFPRSADVAGEIPDFDPADMETSEKASQSRGDLRSMEMRSENAERSVEMAETEYLPYVGVGGAWQWNDPSHPFGGQGDSWNVSAFLRWNLFDGTRREHERSKARHQARQAREHLLGLRKAIAFGIHQARLGVEESRTNLELAREALKTAEEGKRLVQMRYENSFSPIVDMLDAQVVLD
ncbi:MAG: TolC family protein, partial [Syntrophales bacterium]|nr:TolC family protein [Syntrophales bacterium]